jgi:hypothetical protein
MIPVRVTDEHGMNLAKPNVLPTLYCVSGIVENPHTGRIFEQKSSVQKTEIAGTGSQWSDLNGSRLRPGERSYDMHHDEREHDPVAQHKSLPLDQASGLISLDRQNVCRLSEPVKVNLLGRCTGSSPVRLIG